MKNAALGTSYPAPWGRASRALRSPGVTARVLIPAKIAKLAARRALFTLANALHRLLRVTSKFVAQDIGSMEHGLGARRVRVCVTENVMWTQDCAPRVPRDTGSMGVGQDARLVRRSATGVTASMGYVKIVSGDTG